MGGDYYFLFNMRKSKPREVKTFLQDDHTVIGGTETQTQVGLTPRHVL